MGSPMKAMAWAMIAVFAALSIDVRAASADSESAANILPGMPVAGCRGERAKLYDECGSQIALFEQALALAETEGKTVLVSYGAEWCIWCHVFDAYVRGEHTRFTYTYSDPNDEERYTSTLFEFAENEPEPEASDVAGYFADTFVLVHIENRYSADGLEVLDQTGARAAFWGGLPFIFSVTPLGEFATEFSSDLAETRRDSLFWYRGYDRGLLKSELIRLEDEASQ